MKRLLSFVLILGILATGLTGVAEEKKGLFGSIGDGLSDAWNWTKGAADDVAGWTSKAANDAANWTSGAANDAWNWTSNAANDAWDWTSVAASDALDWTKIAAEDAWNWSSENASKLWTTTTTAVSGTWEEIFGKGDETGPHHLCIASPLFKVAQSIDSISENGINTECFRYDDTYEIILVSFARDKDLLPPQIGEITLTDFVTAFYDQASVMEGDAAGAGVRAMAQSLRYLAVKDGLPLHGRALGIWTDHYIVVLMVSIDASEGNAAIQTEAEEFFDLCCETLNITETKTLEPEQDAKPDKISSVLLTASNVATANRLYDEVKFHAYQGHGFAAEQANTLADNIANIFSRKKATVVGDDFAPNGADRKITAKNGPTNFIQSKYCQTAKASIAACFDDEGFRYFNSDGTPMQVEVAADQFDDAVAEMRQRISNHEIKGVTDPDDAEKIVRKGTITYKQASRIAKAGTIESITYDAVNGCVESLYSMSLSTVFDFAVNMWNGSDFETALRQSAYTGLQVGGTSFVVSVLSSQIAKAGMNSILVSSSEKVIDKLGTKAAQNIVNAFRKTPISGAAAKSSAAKLLRTNTITTAVSFVVLAVPDVVDTFRGKISGKQCVKNVVSTGSGLAGGMGGWYGGALLGSMIVPGVGTVIGGIIGSVAGGYATQFATGKLMDTFIEDDADDMLDIVKEEYELLAAEYLLNEEENTAVGDALIESISGEELQNMFTSSVRNMYAREVILRPILEAAMDQRETIILPDGEVFSQEMTEILDEIEEEEDHE